MPLISRAQSYYLGPFDPRLKVTEFLKEGLERLFPPDAHIKCSGRLHISMTSLSSYKNVIVNQFKTRDELIRWMVDGGATNNLPELDMHTITVSPFCGDSDICPKDDWGVGHVFISHNSFLVNYANLCRLISVVWPKTPEQLVQLVQQGYNDALRFLLRQGMIRCSVHHQQLVFMTVRVSTGGMPDCCHHCRRVLRKALTSSTPQSVLNVITTESKSGDSWLSRLVKSKLLRCLRLLAAPATLPMAIIYQLVVGAVKSLSLVPFYLKPMFAQLQDTLAALESVFNRAFAATSRTERAAILCRSLTDLELGLAAAGQPAPDQTTYVQSSHSDELHESSPSSALPLCNLKEEEEGECTSEEDCLMNSVGVVIDDPIQLKHFLAKTTSTGEASNQFDCVEGFADAVTIETITKVDLDMEDMDPGFADDEDSSSSMEAEEEERECTRDDRTESGISLETTEELADIVMQMNSHLSWCYRDSEDSEDVKMFMVVPLEKAMSSRLAKLSGRGGEETSGIGSTPVDTDFSYVSS